MGRGGGGGSRVGGGGGSLLSKTFHNVREYARYAQMAANVIEGAGGTDKAYFAVIEMIQNASRFGKTPIDIRIVKKGEYIIVKVTDRGPGFNVDKYRHVDITQGLDGGTHGRGIPAMIAAGKVTTGHSGGKFTITLKTKIKKAGADIDDLLDQFGGGF